MSTLTVFAVGLLMVATCITIAWIADGHHDD